MSLHVFGNLVQLKDKYGSPSLDEVSSFSREFYRSLEAKIGEQAAGELSVEVSSPVSYYPHPRSQHMSRQMMDRPDQTHCSSCTLEYTILAGSFIDFTLMGCGR